MPFLMPTFGDGTGSRVGTTYLSGSLTPIVDASGAFLTVDIGAYPPLGTIQTVQFAGVAIGVPPFGTSMLAVSVFGVASYWYNLASWIGGYTSATGDVTITVVESSILERPKRRPSPRRYYTSPASKIFPDKWTAIIGWQVDRKDNEVLISCNLNIPVRPLREYSCFVTLTTTATCEGVTGSAWADCSTGLSFSSIFAEFTNP
jgi:hypothetical protein